MTVKTFNNFICESLNDFDKTWVKELIKTAWSNLNEYSDYNEFEAYTKEEYDDGIVKLFISAEEDTPIELCADDICIMILPSNHKPNVLVSMESGSYADNARITNFTAVYDEDFVKTAKKIYDSAKQSYPDVLQVRLTLAFVKRKKY